MGEGVAIAEVRKGIVLVFPGMMPAEPKDTGEPDTVIAGWLKRAV